MKPSPLPLELTIAPFRVSEASAYGIRPERLRRADLDAPFRGVRRVEPGAETILTRCEAYVPLLTDDSCFSHVTAALLWGMWLPNRLQRRDRIDVAGVPPAREPRMRGVIGHTAAVLERATVEGMPVTSPVETLRLISPFLGLGELVAAADSLVRRQEPPATLTDVLAAADHPRRFRGIRMLRLALPMVRANADSAKETDVRLLFADAGLPEPEVNPLVSRPGARKRYGDLVFRPYRTIVEYDGEHHKNQVEEDALRLAELRALGWTVVVITKEKLADPLGVVREVERALAARGWKR